MKSILFRINPKQCNYGKLSDIDVFSSKSNIGKLELKKGDLLFAVASGANRKKGLLGIWKILKEPYIKKGKKVDVKSFTEEFKISREKKQWRIKAKKIKDIKSDNLSFLKETSLNLNSMIPTLIDTKDVKSLLDLVK